MTKIEPDDYELLDGDPFDPEYVQAVQEAEADKVATVANPTKEFVARRMRAYKAVFTEGHRSSDDIKIVMIDLMAFTRAFTTRYNPEQKKQDMLEGRAEVFFRIMQQTRLDADTLFLMYTGAITKP